MRKMASFPLFLFVFMMINMSGCAGTAKPQCRNFYEDVPFHRPVGEAFFFLPYLLYPSTIIPDENITWYKNNSEEISNNEEERVHYHGGRLFFLNLKTEDSGFYVARHNKPLGKCNNYHFNLTVFNTSRTDNKVLFISAGGSGQNIKVPCPEVAKETCQIFKGKLIWEKDSKPVQDQHGDHLWVENAYESNKSIYTCICTWEHNKKEYITTGSRRLEAEATVVHKPPVILSPTHKEQFADKGQGIQLNCSGSCGTNVREYCKANWLIDGKPITQTDGYNLTTKIENPTGSTAGIAILTIKDVSAKDFQSEFTCIVEGLYNFVNSTLTLKQRESITPLIIGGLCVMLFCVLAAVLVKYFAIDLALFFRPYLPISRNNKDGRMFDAYVIYEMQNMDKATEDKLCLFVTKNLPAVLEEKCGYRLFIHGRDDIPGEDRLELVEDRMRQSRRLMVILTPGPESESSPALPENSVIGGFDWQVGLHHALVQREMSVILIQLGDTGSQGYSHLPPGLQHLIQKSAPLKWLEDLRGASAYNSRFWKRVRYLMPATPAKKYFPSAII
ncbi:interleukin-1 receptor-like 1 isoform X2 [Cheilinus undulatus]|uniref:interleukin-1 receptor-like 1 isoform X2 n=1 Tax=Cheilinus undulatus TaxID=241271 RepID=UPI001BD57152|nr:interleukin-1 receptor-like 1 isoform X2 [Cheilinus undulatus]